VQGAAHHHRRERQVEIFIFTALLQKNSSRMPRVSFYVTLLRRNSVQQKKSQSGTGVGIFPTLADPKSDRPEWENFLLWTMNFS
jgi:hypothetical protein